MGKNTLARKCLTVFTLHLPDCLPASEGCPYFPALAPTLSAGGGRDYVNTGGIGSRTRPLTCVLFSWDVFQNLIPIPID